LPTPEGNWGIPPQNENAVSRLRQTSLRRNTKISSIEFPYKITEEMKKGLRSEVAS